MTERRGGLGRGLAALIPSGPAPESVEEAPVQAPEIELAAQSVADDSPVEHDEVPDASPAPVSRETGADIPAPVSRETGGDGASAPVSRESAVGSGSVAGAVYREVPISAITPNPKQPRQVFDEEALGELQHSIREFGLMQPIVVRDLGDERFELIMGERRWRASQLAELDVIPAIVRQTQDDALLRDALLENIHRVQLNPLEEASAYQQLLEEFDVTHDELADRIGRSRPVITNTIRLLRLPMPVQRRVAVGVLSAGHARALLSLDEPDYQEEIAGRIVAEGLSVRATEEAVTLKKSSGPAKQKSAAKKKQVQAPGFDRLADRLSNTLDTEVKVERGQRKGRIMIEFGSVDDLERIGELILGSRGPGIDD